MRSSQQDTCVRMTGLSGDGSRVVSAKRVVTALRRSVCAFVALMVCLTAWGPRAAGEGAQKISPPALATPNATSLNGTGNVFLAATLWGSGGTNTVAMAVADLNGDGKLDYVTANNFSNSVGVFLGNGDGTFTGLSSIAVTCNPVYVTIGDFNGDGKPDLAVSGAGCGPGTNGITILLGNGDGTFTTKGILTASLSNPYGSVVGDFNGDGKLDLAVVDRGATTDSVFFFFGNGDGTFQTPVGVSLGASAAANEIVAADFNKDGHLDVAVSEINGSNVVVILGNGNGTFQAPRTNALPAQGWGLAVADVNEDGVPDIVATTPSNGGVTVFLGAGNGNFTAVKNPQTGTTPTANAYVPGGGCTAITLGDFNKDGKLDIAAGLSGVNSAALVAVLAGNGDGTFGAERLFGVADTPQSIAVGDFNGDGNLDWIASTGQINSANQGSVTLGLGRGDGTFLATEGYIAGPAPSWAVEADFNKDGKLDVIAANPSSQNISILFGNGDGTLQPAVNIVYPLLSPSWVVTGDFNNDGNPDFVVFSSWCPSNISAPLYTYLGKGDGTFQTPVTSTISTSTCSSLNAIVIGDFNGDGKLDIGMLLTPSTGPEIAIMLGNGDGTFQAPKITAAPGTRATWMSVGDLNKDGKLDVVVVQYGNNEIQIFLGNGDGTFQSPTTLATGRLPGFSVLGDFNGDGKVDIVVDNQQDNNAEIYLGNGDGTFNSPTLINIAPSNSPPSLMMADDFNLDGHLDILFGHNDNRGTGISLLLGNGDGTFQTVQNYLVSGFSEVTAVGDFNGDGAPDALLLDSNEQFVAILLNQTPPPVTVFPNSLSFGVQLVGATSSPLTIKTSNNGATAATISVAASGDFAQTNTCPVSPATLAAGSNCTVSVTFKPTATGARDGSVVVSDSLPGSPQTVALTGTGVAPIATLGAASVPFSNQIVGTSSSPQNVSLTNTGTAALASISISITGANSGDFSQTNNCGASLTVSAMCSIAVTFKPTATGARSASVSISDDAANSPQTVALTGTGVAPVATLSAPLTFSSQPVGTTSTSQNVTLTNTGNAALAISSIAITGTNSGDFSQTNTCPASPSTLAVGANCAIAVSFTPTATGARTASVRITDDASGSPQSVSLTGTGAADSPVASLSTTTLSFGNQEVGTSSSPQPVTVTNTGNVTLTIASISVAGANSGDFSQTNTCGSSVAVNANCTIKVTFAPTGTGARSASLSIADNAANSPQAITLAGTGTAPAVGLSPSPLPFGNQLVGVASTPQGITLSNTGTATLTISSIAITGTNSSDFSETNTCGASVAASANCSISVTFKPTANGARSASVSITDNASGSPQSVSLTGTGIAPIVTLSGTTVTFTGQLVTTTSAAQQISITNTGTAPLTISSIAVGGSNSGDFAQTNTCPASNSSLAANAKCSITVTFTPAAAGNRAGTITITDSAAGSPHAVTLTGTGTDFSLGAATGNNCPQAGNCSTSATINTGQTATYDLQVTAMDGFNGSVALTCSGEPATSACAVSPTSVPPNGSSSYGFSVTVSNTTNSVTLPVPRTLPAQPLLPLVLVSAIAALLLALIVAKLRRYSPRLKWVLTPAAAAVLLSVLYSAGCGGGGPSGPPPPPPPTNAVLTITGMSSQVSHTVNLNLTINH